MDTTGAEQADFTRVIKMCHWLTLLLIMMTYGAAWAAHSGLAGEWFQPVMQLHRSLGLTVLTLTIFRLAWRTRAPIPRLPADLHPLQKLAARTTEALLYVLLMTKPLLGLLQTSDGRPLLPHPPADGHRRRSPPRAAAARSSRADRQCAADCHCPA